MPVTPAAAAREEPREERMELRDPVLWDLHRDLLVVRITGFHLYSFRLLMDTSVLQVFT
jgi:hypothetical protein